MNEQRTDGESEGDDQRLTRLVAARARLRRGEPVELPRRIIDRAQRLADEAGAVVDVRTAERVINESNQMVHAHFLARGVRAARAVARLVRLSGAGEILSAEGTGSLISPRVIITNHHVIPTGDKAGRCGAEFGLEYDVAGRLSPSTIFRLDPEVLFETSEELDVTVVALARGDDGGLPGQTFGHNALAAGPGRLVVGEHMNIVQHPAGSLKQVSFRDNRAIEDRDHFLAYETDTEPGSSGSPVFNDQWALVAVHREALARVDADGRYVTKEGGVWSADMPDTAIDWYANEGVKSSAVLELLRGCAREGERGVLLDECLED